ncbi:cysteine dioxygenase [Streptomyces hirsutus]
MSGFPCASPCPPRVSALSASGAAPGPTAVPGTASLAAAGPSQADLLDFVRRVAADAELVASLPLDPEGRTWVRLTVPRAARPG